MRPVIALPSALRHGPFTRATAHRYGFTDAMLRGRRFTCLSREVYVSAGTPLDHATLCRAACLAVPEGVLSGYSATVALGLPTAVAEQEPDRAQVTVPTRQLKARRRLVTCHVRPLPPDQVVSTPWGPATSPARTFLDRAAEIDLRDLVGLGDAVLHHERATRAELEAVLDGAGPGGRGVARARRALGLLDGAAASMMESRTRVELVLGGCPTPEVNATILDAAGGWLAEGDLVWRAARLIVEYDGMGHRAERQRRIDLQRRNLLTAEGWTVLHVTADDVLRRPYALVALVKQQLATAW